VCHLYLFLVLVLERQRKFYCFRIYWCQGKAFLFVHNRLIYRNRNGFFSTRDLELGNIIFDSTMIFIGGVFLAVTLYFIMVWARNVLHKDQNIHGTSRWANTKDIQAVGLFEEAGIVVGQEESAKVDYSITNGSVKLSLRSPG